MSTRQYIGARYVPKFFKNPNGGSEWIKETTYEALTIVTHLGNSYTSKKPVPLNTDITNTDYWALTGNYNAQVEEYRKEVAFLKNYVTPQMFGAKGNGVDDDTEAFKRAFSSSDNIYIPKGTYVILEPLTLNSSKTITGESKDNTFIIANNGFIICNQPSTIKNLRVNGNRTSDLITIKQTTSIGCYLNNIIVYNGLNGFVSKGINTVLENCYANTCANNGFHIENVDCYIVDCESVNNRGYGFYLKTGPHIVNNVKCYLNKIGVYCENTQFTMLNNINTQQNYEENIYLYGNNICENLVAIGGNVSKKESCPNIKIRGNVILSGISVPFFSDWDGNNTASIESEYGFNSSNIKLNVVRNRGTMPATYKDVKIQNSNYNNNVDIINNKRDNTVFTSASIKSGKGTCELVGANGVKITGVGDTPTIVNIAFEVKYDSIITLHKLFELQDGCYTGIYSNETTTNAFVYISNNNQNNYKVDCMLPSGKYYVRLKVNSDGTYFYNNIAVENV